MKTKYPKTLHLPWSPGVNSDDKIMRDLGSFAGEDVVVAVKLDGENTSMSRDYIHARSLDSRDHPSRSWVKALHAGIQCDIPAGFIVCGENCYATHSLHYSHLPSYFFAFNIWNRDIRLSWDEMMEYCELLGIQHVPVVWRGIWNEDVVRDITLSLDLKRNEGVVVQATRSIHRTEWARKAAKFVRAGHVQTDDFWMNGPMRPNGLDLTTPSFSADVCPSAE